jgi:chromosome segregation ATPase
VLRNIKIENFQSHENTTLEFSPGITAIIGESDSGKSAIMRAIRWVVDNRPTGEGFISWWNFQKGKLAGSTKVTIETDDFIAVREKNKDGFNGYMANTTVYGTVGTDVPISITDGLNINEMNIHRQFESHFLLSMSAGDVAKYLNKLVKLDVIDTVIQNGTSEQRDLNGKVKDAQKSLIEAEDTITKYSWVLEAEKVYAEISEIDSVISKSESTMEGLLKSISLLNEAGDYIKKYRPLVAEADGIISDIKSLDQTYALMDEKWSAVSSAIGKIKQAGDALKFKQVVDDAIGIMEMIRSVNDLIDTEKKKEQDMGKAVLTILSTTQSVIALRKELEAAKASMPKLCPTCGQPLKEDVCTL